MKYKYITSIFPMLFVSVLSVMSLVTPDRESSSLEGRDLQVFPSYSNLKSAKYLKDAYIDELLDGSLFGKFDNYFSDHIYLRDDIVSAYSSIQMALGQKLINGAYLSDDDYIISPLSFELMSDDEIENSANHFNEIANRFNSSKSYLVNLPRKNIGLSDKMPIRDYQTPQEDAINKLETYIDNRSLSFINMTPIIKNTPNAYFKTDHHFNMNGAFATYTTLINELSKEFPQVGEAKSKDDFDIKIYESALFGSDARKVGNSIKYKDDIELYYSDDYDKFIVENAKGKTELLRKDIMEDASIIDKYRVYLGGNNPKLHITNPNSKNNLKIVMIGDSMDNTIVPLMASHFEEVYSFDQRKAVGFNDDIDTLVEKINPDIIMFIGTGNYILDANKSEIFKWNLKDLDNHECC